MSKDFKNYSTALGVVIGLVATVSYLSHIKAGKSYRQVTANRYGVSNAVYQQDVDHFSDDARAMSPRDWGSDDSSNEPVAPRVTFGEPQDPATEEIQLTPDSSRFQQADHGELREPRNFYETDPLNSEHRIEPDSGSHSSPLPSHASTAGRSLQQDPSDKKSDSDSSDSDSSSTLENQEKGSPTKDEVPLESRIEPYDGPVNSPGLSSEGEDSPKRNLSEADSEQLNSIVNKAGDSNCPPMINGGSVSPFCNDCGKPYTYYNAPVRQPRNRRQLRNRENPYSIGIGAMSCGCTNQDIRPGGWDDGECQSNSSLEPKYNPSLGHRSPDPVTDQFTGSSGETFPFEEDQQYPSMSEILASSIYFGEAEFMFLQPSFSGNTAFTAISPGSAVSQPFNFDLEPAFRVMAGYESEYGPGFAGEYFQFDNNSDCSCFTSDGITTGETRVYQLGQNRWSSILAVNPGETINTFHSLEVHSTGVYAFKALKFKRAYVNGKFGIQVASIDQKIYANLLDAGGSIIGQLRGNTNLNAFGPRFGIDYVRRIGHTPMQIVSSATGSILFGDRDQEVTNTFSGEFSSAGSDEFVTVIDIFFGVQAKQHRGEKKNTTMRLGFVNQSWIGGGTANDPTGDFGFQGVSMMLGFNR